MPARLHPSLFTVLAPSVLREYDIQNSIVVVIDIIRATSSITAALHAGLDYIIPVDNIHECKSITRELGALSAGERNGKIIEGFDYGNSPLELLSLDLKNKKLVLTTTNGTRLLKMAENQKAMEIIVGSFGNLSATVNYLIKQKKTVILACSGWKNRINIEDALFAGAVAQRLENHFFTDCDSSLLSKMLYKEASKNIQDFYPKLSHYQRLKKLGLIKDVDYCFRIDTANILIKYVEQKLIAFS